MRDDKFRRKLTHENIEEIVRLREEERKPSALIASQFGVNQSTVNYHLLRAGVDPWDSMQDKPNQRGAFTPEEDARMLELGRAGLSPWKISQAIGRPKTSVLIRLLTLEVRAEKKEAVA